MGDDEVDVLFLDGDDVDLLALVFHDLGEVVEDVPVLLVVETADDTYGFDFLDVFDALVARGGLEVADDLLASKVFDEFQHILWCLVSIVYGSKRECWR